MSDTDEDSFPEDRLKATVAGGPFVGEKAACERLGIAYSLLALGAFARMLAANAA